MKNKIRYDRLLQAMLLLVNLAFMAYWCILAFYSRPHYDDLHFLLRMREMSVCDFVKHFYLTRSGRFVVYGIDAVVSNITDALGCHILWALAYYVIGVGLCWMVVKDMKSYVSRFGLFMGTCFIYNLYVLTNIDFPVFYWTCAMMYYLSMPCSLLLMKFLNLKQLNWTQWMIFITIVLFIGGSYETYTPIVLFLMFINGMYYWHSNTWSVKETWAVPQVRRIVGTAIILLVLLAIVIAAPGNYVRMNSCEEFIHPVGLLGWVKAIGEAVGLFVYFMVFYVPYYLVAFILAFYAGCKSEGELLPVSKVKLVVWIGIGFMVLLILLSLPNVYLYNGFGIQRTYTPAVLLLLLAFVAVGYVLGLGRRSNWAGWCSICGLIVMFAIMCVNVAFDTPTAREYARAVDNRIEELCLLRDKGQKETVTVAPLPVPYTEDVKHLVLSKLGKDVPMAVLYYISDTEEEPNEYEFYMKQLYDLDFNFVLPRSEQE